VKLLCGFDDGRGKVCGKLLAQVSDTRELQDTAFRDYNEEDEEERWVLLPCPKHDLVGIPADDLFVAEAMGRRAVHFRRRFPGVRWHEQFRIARR
jgi:hypothetical protein